PLVQCLWVAFPHRPEAAHRSPPRSPAPVSSHVPPPDYMEGEEDDDLIKPKKLVNPVKASKSHQDLHRELLMSYKRGGGVGVETKPELQRVLEARKREQLIKQRKQEDEARKKISPLEQELLKRHKKLEEVAQPAYFVTYEKIMPRLLQRHKIARLEFGASNMGH
uniref:Actin-associated protein FAM107A n=1 Tax=Myripristis murdjan TaxID=586833 RepID=A0A667YB81_9TELE